MVRSVTICDVPEETSAELAARAALTGRSLREYLRRHLVEFASAPDTEASMARVRTRKCSTASSLSAEET